MAVSSGISHTEVHGRGPQVVGRPSDGLDKPCSSGDATDQFPEYKPGCHINEELVRPPVRPLQPSRRLSQQRPRRAPKGRPRLRRRRRRPGRQGSPTRYKRAGCATRCGGGRGQPHHEGECRPEPRRRPEPTADRQETPSRETQVSGLAEGVAGPGGADVVRLAGCGDGDCPPPLAAKHHSGALPPLDNPDAPGCTCAKEWRKRCVSSGSERTPAFLRLCQSGYG